MESQNVAPELDLTGVDIVQLEALRDDYPFVEWVESPRHFAWLCFLRWRVRRGDLGGPADGAARPFPVEAFTTWAEERSGIV